MKLTETNNKMLSNAVSESINFGVTDMRIIMEVLTKLYSNPIRTLTQEYICNARDAHREVGQTKPIEIDVPTRFNPVLKIRDFGPGLSPERVKNVFVYYGSSTKRETDEQTGGFGIGAKSAWAYTDSFIIHSYHNGTHYAFNANRANGLGTLTVLFEQFTTKANGVCIEIAVNPKDCDLFKKSVFYTTFFWNENEKPTIKGLDSSDIPIRKPSVTISNLEIYDSLPNCFDNHRYIVVDGIPFFDKNYFLETLVKKSCVVKATISEVSIAPTREDLVYNDKTNKFLQQTKTRLERDIAAHVSKELNNLPSLKGAIKHAVELRNTFHNVHKYKNYTLNDYYVEIDQMKKEPIAEYTRRKGKIATQYTSSLRIKGLYYYNDVDETKVKAAFRRKKIITNSPVAVYVFPNTAEYAEIIKDFDAIPLSSIDISDFKINRQARAAVTKRELCLHVHTNNTYKPTQIDLKDNKTTFVYGSLTGASASAEMINYIKSLKDTKYCVIAESNFHKVANDSNFIKLENFIKTHKPNDKTIKWYLRNKLKEKVTINYYSFLSTSYITAEKFKDKKLAYMKTLLDFKPGLDAAISLPSSLVDDKHPLVVEYTKHLANVPKDYIKKNYLLLDSLELPATLSDNNKANELNNDIINYVNSKYRANNKRG